MNLSLLDGLIFLPILCGFLLIVFPVSTSGTTVCRFSRVSALLFLVLTLNLFCCHGGISVNRSWIPSIGASYSLKADEISSIFLFLTALLVTVLTFWWPKMEFQTPKLYGLLFLTAGSLAGVFLAKDLLLFYLFWELMLVPIYIAIGMYGGRRRIYATLFFVVYTVIGSILMLGASIYMALKHADEFGVSSFSISQLSQLTTLTPQETFYLTAAFLLAFLVKLPAFPFHAWLPATYSESPYVFTVFLAGIVGKAGLFGIIAIAIPLFGVNLAGFAPYLALLGVIGIVYGALTACVQNDLKHLFAYSSLSHLGTMLLGVASGSKLAFVGALFFAVAHTLSIAFLFVLGGALKERFGITQVSDTSGLAVKNPKLSSLLFIAVLAGLGFPLTASFVGELLIFIGSYGAYPVYTVIATTGVVFSAIYLLTMFIKAIWGQEKEAGTQSLLAPEQKSLGDIGAPFVIATLPLVAALFILGVYPAPLLRILGTGVTLGDSK